MPLDVQLYGGLAPDLPRRQAVDARPGRTVADITLALGIPPADIYLIMIDGVQVDLEDLVPLDGRLCFFPYLSGG